MTTWNLVVARKGSKGCPGKSIRTLPDGSTCLSRAIKIAFELPGETILSTDYSPEAIERQMEIRWQFPPSLNPCRSTYRMVHRPDLLAADSAPMIGVVIHALAEAGAEPNDRVVLLQASSPFRSRKTVEIVTAFDIGTAACSAMPYPATWHPRYALGQKRPLPACRHEIEPAYRPDGGVYTASVKQVLTGTWGPFAWVCPPAHESLTIDTEADWAEAERRVRAEMAAMKG